MKNHELVKSPLKVINWERLEMTLIASACSAAFLFGISACGGGGGFANAAPAVDTPQVTTVALVSNQPTQSNTTSSVTATAAPRSQPTLQPIAQPTATADPVVIASGSPSLAGAKSLPLAPPVAAGPSLEGCPLFPANNIMNQPIDTAPVHANSAAFIATIGATRGAKADFGSGTYLGGPIGINYNVVTSSQPKVPVVFEIAGESDPGPYPIAPDALVEGGDASTGDRHVLVLDKTNCKLYETFNSFKQPDNSWTAYSGAVFDLTSNALRPDGWTSSDAAGYAILPALVRYDEVASGEINHALRFTVPRTSRRYVWPATHFASTSTDPALPDMGLRFRLKADVDISGFHPQMQVILRALKKYGMVLADNGQSWFISGAPDDRWDNTMLRQMSRITGNMFEAVDVSSKMINPRSGQSK
jgi:hypothetical protein